MITYRFNAPPEYHLSSFRLTDARLLSAPESVAWLDCRRLSAPPDLPPDLDAQIRQGTVRAVNARHPNIQKVEHFLMPRAKRINLLAVGDVGGTLLIGLKLLGGGCIEQIGICDLDSNAVARWTAEMEQISWPWNYGALPQVVPVEMERLFDCDVLLFAAAKAVPALDCGVRDVRMAQLETNRPIVEHYARMARDARFDGLFVVLSDPVDPLCRAAYSASNRGLDGHWDGLGLLAEQIQGFGLGVMNARTAALAQKDSRFASFLDDGRVFGPHGEGLVAANSLSRYDNALSLELTDLVKSANHRIRALGYKPYAAPALSSGAFQLLLTLRGEWHCSSVCLGGVWFGCRNRYTQYGLEIESAPLPDLLFQRLQETERLLHSYN